MLCFVIEVNNENPKDKSERERNIYRESILNSRKVGITLALFLCDLEVVVFDDVDVVL